MDYTYKITEIDKNHPQGGYIKIEYYREGFPTVPYQVAIPRVTPGGEAQELKDFAEARSTVAINIWKRIEAEQEELNIYNEYLETIDVSGVEVGVVVPKVYEEPQPSPDNYEYIPDAVSMRQARLALSRQGLLAQVQTGINSLSEESQIEWEYAGSVERNSPLVQSLGAALGLTETQLDDLFILAATL